MLQRPGLVVLTGPPGSGRSTALRELTAAVPGPVHSGGGLAMLQTVPALALSRAVRARLPAHDVHLLAEAVRSRVRAGLLVLDDIQYADAATLAALPALARFCRVLVALRTPHRLSGPVLDSLRAAATAWVEVPPLGRDAALELAGRTAGGLDPALLSAVVDRAGGNPLAITALARQAAAAKPGAGPGIDQVAYAIATALSDLPRPARTALAALGLLGRPAPAGLLGAGAADLLAAGLVAPAGLLGAPGSAGSSGAVGSAGSSSAAGSPGSFGAVGSAGSSGVPGPAGSSSGLSAAAGPAGSSGGDLLVPVSTYVAETAAGLLDAAARVELHTRLAELTPPAEAARHLAAAGDLPGAHRRALVAADQTSGGDRAELLLFACELDVPIDPRVRIAAADALLTAGRASAAARVLVAAEPLGPEADVLRGEALLQADDPQGARAAVRSVPDAATGPVLAARDRVLLLAELAADPASAQDLAGKISARHPQPTPGVAAALAAVQARFRTPGWDSALASAARSGDPLISRWAAWLLVEQLAADGRLAESADVALAAARDSAADLSYGWQTRFAAAADWALALHGSIPGELLASSSPVSPAGSAAVAGSADVRADSAGAAGLYSGSAGPAAASAGAAGLYSGSAGPAAASGTAGAASAGSGGVVSGSAGTAGAASAGSAGSTPTAVPGSSAAIAASAGAAGVVSASAVPGGAVGAVSGTAGVGLAGAVHGSGSAGGAGVRLWDGSDGVLKRASNLTDRALPDEARGYATAATALIEADTGLLAAARAHLDAGPAHPATAWVAQETAWLDGQPDRALGTGGDADGLLAGLHAITARWAAFDLGEQSAPPIPGGLPGAARRTLTAWATGTGFTAAAEGWKPIALRERIRCLIAAGVTDTDSQRAVAALLSAEQLADAAGFTVLAGRARRGLRRHHVHRDTRSPRSGDQLTRRETDVLRLVAAGEPTRRIAGQLGISAETVDTHIRAGMRKLGARTRTEAAALAFTHSSPPDMSDTHKDGR
ncbi:LuxR family transcriptional regulator [Actinoplanes sp. LDG1-06]|uniref:LuxR family transcriptional regulator n=1 Tax=Paractinoplanes ovalisporus TaxID=2810368 RepID=A0ABS2A8H7_9ACTN|nr:LuxR family transcriptional regulator [Actinoplanes ovalisporus]